MDMQDLQVQLLLLELADCYLQMSVPYRSVFVQYLQDEYAGIDDVFGEMIDVLVQGLYEYQALMHDPNSFTRPEDETLTVRQMKEMTQEFITELSDRISVCLTLQEGEVDNPMENLELLLQSMVNYAKDALEDDGGMSVEELSDGWLSDTSCDSEYSSSSSEMDLE